MEQGHERHAGSSQRKSAQQLPSAAEALSRPHGFQQGAHGTQASKSRAPSPTKLNLCLNIEASADPSGVDACGHSGPAVSSAVQLLWLHAACQSILCVNCPPSKLAVYTAAGMRHRDAQAAELTATLYHTVSDAAPCMRC